MDVLKLRHPLICRELVHREPILQRRISKIVWMCSNCYIHECYRILCKELGPRKPVQYLRIRKHAKDVLKLQHPANYMPRAGAPRAYPESSHKQNFMDVLNLQHPMQKADAPKAFPRSSHQQICLGCAKAATSSDMPSTCAPRVFTRSSRL